MKTPIFAFAALFSAALVAESQMPAAPLAVAPAVDSSAPADEIDLMADDDDARVELTAEGDRVSIVCEDAPIADVLRQFRRVIKANVISCESTNLHKRVSLALYDAPWIDSMRAVLDMGGFALDERDGIYFVMPEQAENPVVRTKSFALQHANADELARLLNESFGEKDPKTGRMITGVASVFKDANVIVVMGTDKVIRDCEDVIETVDKAPEQVYVEARFIELSASAMHKLGIDWSVLENYKVEVKNLKLGTEQNRGKLANYSYTQPDNTRSASADVSSDGTRSSSSSASISSHRTSLVPTEIPESTAIMDLVGGQEQARSMLWKSATAFSGQLSADNFALAISAFENMGDAKMFSNPRIIVSNGKRAEVDMTTKYPNVRVTSNRTGGLSDSLDITAQLEQIPGEKGAMFAKEVFFSWGITLEVTPRISPDGLINVEIVPTISDRSDWAEVQGGEGSAYSKYPVIDVQRLVTDFTMKDGSTAVIGGLTRTQEQDVDTGIPYLRKIPFIGPWLFGWKGREKVQKEIIVFVTVGIANPRALKTDVGLPKNAVLGREYVEGTALEPGDRGSARESMKLDMRAVDDRRGKFEPQLAKPAEGEAENAVLERLDGLRQSSEDEFEADGPSRDYEPAALEPAQEPAPAEPAAPSEDEAAGPVQDAEVVMDRPARVRVLRHGRMR